MIEERRSNTLNDVLIQLGRMEEIANSSKTTIEELKDRVGIQNGRVTGLEAWKNKAQGSLNILVLLVLPISFYVVYELIKRLHF